MKKLNRGWVKNAAIIFLVVLVILLILSNTIMNFSLEEVEVDQPRGATITTQIRGPAMVEANNRYSVEVESPREVLAVFIRAGDTIEEGSPLFELEASELLEAAIEELAQLRIDYERAALGDTGDTAADLAQARGELARAQADRNALGTATGTETTAQIRFDTADANVDALEAELDYIDTLDRRSTRIGELVHAAEEIELEMIALTGFRHDAFVARIADLEEERDLLIEAGGNQTILQGIIAELAELNRHAPAMVALNAELTIAERELNAAAATARMAVTAELSTAQVELNAATSALAQIRAITKANEEIATLQRTINSLERAQALGNIDMRVLREEIADLEAEIRELEGEDGARTVITSKHEGTVAHVSIAVGQTAEPGLPIAEIDIAALGYVAELSVDAQRAQLVRPGTPVEVQTGNWFVHAVGRVSAIRPSTADPSQRIIVVDIEGELTSGEQVGLAVLLDSNRYDIVVPRSAVRNDAQGHHVFIIHARQSPLGTRYMAQRVDVSVLAEDDTLAAISGAINWFDNVIVRSSGPVSDRDYVRLAE